MKLTPDVLVNFGFEKKPLLEWSGNGYGYSDPTDSITKQIDLVYPVYSDTDIIVRFETWSWFSKSNQKHIEDPEYINVYLHRWYEKCEENRIPFCIDITFEDLQMAILALTGFDLFKNIQTNEDA